MLHLIIKALQEKDEEKFELYLKMIERRIDRATLKIICICALILFVYVMNYLIGY